MPLDFEGARFYALNQLEAELSPQLYYHSLIHTRDDVVPAVARIASGEHITGETLTLLLTAAYFHDIGFTQQRQEHEAIGARIAADMLPDFGYTAEQIALIQSMIMATHIPQLAATPLEQILADADLDVLGRDDFFSRNKALRDEVEAFAGKQADIAWYEGQIRFMRNHRYFTATARALRDTAKSRHIALMAEKLETLKTG